MDIEHISVSRGKTYKDCGQKYKFRYHLKTPSPIPEKFHFTYGKIVHKIAEIYIESKGERSINEISVDVLNGNIEFEPGRKAPKLPADYAKRLPVNIKYIQNLTSRIGYDGIVEQAFYYDLEPPNEKYIKGFIDRLVIRGDKAFILDYKTTKKGKWRVTKESVIFDLQLRMYARVTQKMFNIAAHNISCALYYVEDGELIPAKYSENSLIQAEKELLKIYDEIKSHDPDRVIGTVNDQCGMCEYATICPFYKPKNTNFNTSWDGDLATLHLYQKK